MAERGRNINTLSQEEMEMWQRVPPRGIHGAWLLPRTPEMRRLHKRLDTELWAIPTVQHRSSVIMKYYGGFDEAFRAGLVRATTDRAPQTTLFLEGTAEGIDNMKFEAIDWYSYSSYPYNSINTPLRVVLDVHTASGIVTKEMSPEEFLAVGVVPEYSEVDVRGEMRERLLRVRPHRRRGRVS